MKEKRNEASTLSVSKRFLLVNSLAFVFLFIFLTPKVSAKLFPFVAEQRLNNFLEKSQSSQNIDPRGFWEFREFYSPGSFVFNKFGISGSVTQPILQKSGVSLNNRISLTPFLVFDSPHLKSVDYITDSKNFEEIVMLPQLDKEQILIQNNTEILYRKDSSTYVIAFLKTPAEMRSANGFFDYRIADKELTEGKYWVNITTITH